MFRLSKLLELAGIELDGDENVEGEPRREAGTSLEIQVVYNNLHRWWSTFGQKDV